MLFRRGDPCFFAFDLLVSDGKDWRTGPYVMERESSTRFKILNRGYCQKQGEKNSSSASDTGSPWPDGIRALWLASSWTG